MSNIVIACNHSYPLTGGCEKVVQQVAESMVEKSHKVSILSKSYTRIPFDYNGVRYQNCGINFFSFMKNIDAINPDYLMIYSDFFIFWPEILAKTKNINCKKIIFPVGLNATYKEKNSYLFDLFKNRSNDFIVVTHSSDYRDYNICKGNGIPVRIIPNGINFEEISKKDFSFREKYSINTKYILLCISNFFPGKAQEKLIPILNEVYKEIKDFTVVFICSTTSSSIINRTKSIFSSILEKYDFQSRVLCDIPREEVIESLFESDIFLFPSQKEVAPLVLLESMAAKLPWISLNVGNASALDGGVIVNSQKDKDGNCVYDNNVNTIFAKNILKLLLNSKLRKRLGKNGFNKVFSDFNWKDISESYNELFTL